MTGTEAATVVVGFDGSAGAERALAAAGRLLDAASLVVVTVQRSGLPGTGASRKAQAEQINARGVELAREHGAASGMVVAGRNAATGILDAAEQVGASALVVGFRGHSTARSMLLGSSSYALAHRATLPTLVVPDNHPAAGDATGAALVCVDESDDAPQHLSDALQLVRADSAIVMHVGEGRLAADHIFDEHGKPLTDDQIKAQVAAANEATREHAGEIAQRATAQLAEGTDKQLTPLGEVSVGSAWQGIVDRADAGDVGLIVIGARALGALDRTTLGSISNAVVHHARTPVLIAHTASA
jgi:nucleotide-binding universal stress UspA family protein